MSKSKKERRPFSATAMRLILSLTLVAILAGMAAGFYLAYSSLQSKAESVAQAQSEAVSSDAKLQYLMSLRSQLDKYKSTAAKAEQIVAESQSYQYQNQIINDLTSYANRSGIRVSSFNFQEVSPGASAQPSSSSSDASSESQASASTGSGPKSTRVSVQLGDDIQYQNLLHFLHLIEQNLTKMQISSLSLSGGPDGAINTQALDLEVYIR